jgi:TonB-dependent SusC/RagA subfamily outer membrane receptor
MQTSRPRIPNSAAARARRAMAVVVSVLGAATLVACSGAARSGGSVRDLSRLYRTDAASASSVVDFSRVPLAGMGRIEEVLQGRVPGLQVVRLSGGDYSLRIRGGTSILGSNEPLLVLDGQIISPPFVSNALAGISPHDVARVEVLKDGGSLAFYGSRGANGVIIVSTRRGHN